MCGVVRGERQGNHAFHFMLFSRYKSHKDAYVEQFRHVETEKKHMPLAKTLTGRSCSPEKSLLSSRSQKRVGLSFCWWTPFFGC